MRTGTALEAFIFLTAIKKQQQQLFSLIDQDHLHPFYKRGRAALLSSILGGGSHLNFAADTQKKDISLCNRVKEN